MKISESAANKVKEFMDSETEADLALRIGPAEMVPPGGSEFEFGLVRAEDRMKDDVEITADGLRVFVDASIASRLDDATFEYVDDGPQSGFRVTGAGPRWDNPVAQRVQTVLDDKINPGVASHGGHVSLLDVKENRAFIRLSGGCQGCGMANVTLKQGIEVMIKEDVPEITEVIDSTDHAGGTNPYYQGDAGASPVA